MKIEPFQLERYFAKHEFSARYLISSSDAEAMTVRQLLDFEPHARESLLDTYLSYNDSAGSPALREAIAATYSSLTPAHILAHTGAQEPIFNFLNCALAAGDHVIAHSPGYQSVYSIPKAIGCELELWHARPTNMWAPDLAELKRMLRPNTRAVLVNFPHNPTGFVPAREWMQELIQLLRPRGILLLSDEVYRGLEFAPAERLPAAADLYENAISVGVLSKAYGLPGLRIGWIATRNDEIYQAMAAFKDYTTICNSVVTERLATIAIRHSEQLFARNRAIVESNLALVESFFAGYPGEFGWHRPLGGTMMFAWAEKGRDMEAFSERLLIERQTMLISGCYFDQPESFFRLGLGRLAFPEGFAQFTSLMESELG
jgi:aspartate/methionine/tyrosine aminotransferase